MSKFIYFLAIMMVSAAGYVHADEAMKCDEGKAFDDVSGMCVDIAAPAGMEQ